MSAIYKLIVVGAVAGAALLRADLALSQGNTYPDKPIRMLVAFPAGGPTDVNARLFAQYMGERLGQPVVVENRPGAGGNVASTMAANAPKDGYTLLYNTSSFLLGALAYKSATHNPMKDFVRHFRNGAQFGGAAVR